jgi:hypothetical protein
MTETPPDPLDRFGALVAELMEEWRIPRLADGGHPRGRAAAAALRGVCDIDNGAPVAPDTGHPRRRPTAYAVLDIELRWARH